MMEKSILIEARGLKTHFQVRRKRWGEKAVVKAVDDVSFDIYRGETLGLVGESGCGKSTLGRSILRMIELSDGSLKFCGQEYAQAQGAELAAVQKQMQIIFQDAYAAMNPLHNIERVLLEPLHDAKMSPAEKLDRIIYVLQKVSLHEDDLQKYSYEFSGGQRQRIGIARALLLQPEFIFCDEPIAALDVSIQAQVVNMLEDLQEEFQLTYLFAAHDLSMVRYISSRIAVMYLGSFMELVSAETLYHRPLHPYTQALLSAIPIPDPKRAKTERRIELKGELPSPINVPPACKFAPRCPYAKEHCHKVRPEWREIETGHFVACHEV